MLNQYPLWKYLLVLFIISIGFIYAAPNLYAPDPAVQISGENSAMIIDEKALDILGDALTEANIEFFGAEIGEKGSSGLIRLKDREQQLPAQKIIQRALGDGYIVALNLASTTPEWLQAWGAEPMKLGLDLSGGVHFLLEVDTASAVAKRMDVYTNGIKRVLREDKIRGFIKLQDDGRIAGKFKTSELRAAAKSKIRSEYGELVREEVDAEDGFYLYLTLADFTAKEIEDYAVGQNLTTLRNRVNELGVAEPLVQRQGRNRIVVELPGIQDTAEAKRILGKTANLEFRLEAKFDAPNSAKEEFKFRNPDRGQNTAFLERDIVITGESVAGASAGFDAQSSQPQVNINLDSDGGALMHRVTRNNIQRRLGVLFIERKSRTRYETNADGEEVAIKVPYNEERIISLATIQDALGVRFRITGLDNPAEASELALLLRAGALAAPIDFVEERTVGPSLGAENIRLGVISVQLGLALVAVFMVFYYRLFGVAAVTGLAANMILLIALMSILSATLTMPGIAGIVLTVGMAVDANVLIFSRIKEELKNRMSPQQAINAGYDRAFVTIMDANITTLLVALILYAVGAGPVRGFAVTLGLGILTSMFTAIVGSRAMINLVYGGRKITKLSI
ncbi:protein translocase subunit SecD [Oceanicoccus sp. KOV_DT_Chl]|uniref:protein translocase subunit SecD n=1 Tax=Oceanicoccus sp. KOV_DT_Chl TaxID=1904639 RepID=UPI000C7CEB41|nr:protein translocase subunit SecD [Oceanicoccus sp. KOV_DT_Chl]